ncbi:MAG TPA: tetrahydromethanopterin S-methyltransferase subunit C [Methanomicrobia archaeon]|nr:tetrahydromethanopterin S-methyltransferase subunit C [Methanomicrobia archaeon]
MTVTPAVVEEEEAEAPKKGLSFKFPFEETEMAIIAGVIAAIITIFTGLPAVIKGIGLLLAILWGNDSVRKTSKYGLGTGVPSIGVLGTGYGFIGALMGLAVVEYAAIPHLGIFPGILIGALFMGALGLASGYFGNDEKYIAMKIPHLIRAMGELGIAGTLAVLLQISILAGTFEYGEVVTSVFETGVAAFIFVFTCMGFFHPYNACLGPDERRERTRMVSVSISGLICVILGAAMFVLGRGLGAWDGIALIIFGVIVWAYFYVKFIRACMNECYATVGTGMIKTLD